MFALLADNKGLQDEREVSEERSEKKRGREWLVEREYISRRLVDTMSSKQDEQQQQQDRQEVRFYFGSCSADQPLAVVNKALQEYLGP